ncbi:MAG: type VII toxin-antitoxin system HepT family RNase toxin [Bacteroidota bacterium]
MPNDDIVINKINIIGRCLKRVNQEYNGNPKNLNNLTKQDSIILNIQRACEACIDLAMHLVAEKSLGIPQNSKDAFRLLLENGILTKELAFKLKAMVGFRNIAVHDYQSLNINILRKIIENHLRDIEEFGNLVLKLE